MSAVLERETSLESERARLQSDFRYFARTMLKIKPKKDIGAGQDGPLVPFIFNEAQEIVWKEMQAMIAAGLPLRLVVLKARQVGISTLFCAWIFWLMWRQKYTKAAIVAYQKNTTLKELNETMATFYANLPENYRPRLRQNRKGGRITKEDVYFDDRKADCMFVVQDDGAMRGVARDAVLCTEVSFYGNPQEFFGGFIPSMSESQHSTLVMESSPAEGYHQDAYKAAKAGRGGAKAIFIPWWMIPSIYSRRVKWEQNGRGERRAYDARTGEHVKLDKAERAEQKILSEMARTAGFPEITIEQMNWRRHKIHDPAPDGYDGDDEYFNQEFPRDDVSCFERASSSAFKLALPQIRATSEEADDVYPDTKMGTLHSTTYTDPQAEQIIEFVPERREGFIDQERRAGLLMFQEPRADYVYTIGADVAGDVDEGETDDDLGERAFSTACVYCCNTREQVAEWRGHLDPHDWGHELVKLGYFYNTALLCVERNNMGVTTEDAIKRILMYPRRYKWPDWNIGLGALTKKEMWETNVRTKQIMIGELHRWCRESLFIVRSMGLADEMAHYLIKNGRYQAKERFADRIIAAALAVMVVSQTEYGHKSIVMAAQPVERSAHGMAARMLKSGHQPGRDMPDELQDMLGTQKVVDLWTSAGV